MNKVENVVILGAGPGGCMTALYLAKLKVPCILVDKAKFPRDKICGDALSGKVVEVLKKYNPEILNDFQNQPYQIGSYGVSFFSPSLETLRVPFFSDPNKKKENPPGFLCKRLDFDNYLVNLVKKEPIITFIEESPYEKVVPGQEYQKIIFKNGEVMNAKLVIAADGAYSQVAKSVGNLQMEPQHYSAGIRTYFSGVRDLDKENFIELMFLKDFLPGYFWIFPLPNGLANVGVGMPSSFMRKKKIDLKKEMIKVIENQDFIKKRFQDAQMIDGMKGFGLPLGSKKRKISGNGFMLVGDAASLIDPFTGEGIGNALVSGMFAAQIAEIAIKNQDFSAKFLAQYDQKVYDRLWPELRLSAILQNLVNYPSLFNFVIRKANRSPTLKQTISCMFEDINLRQKFKNPLFYLKILFGG